MDSRKPLGTPRIILLKIISVIVPASVTNYLDDYFIGRLANYLKLNWSEASLIKVVERLRKECDQIKETSGQCPKIIDGDNEEAIRSSVIAFCEWSVKAGQNKMHTVLNDLQGLIWSEGYKEGTIKIPMYPDVKRSFENWRKAGIKLWTLSSGSVEGQENYFKCSDSGDLTNFFEQGGHMSTTTNGLNLHDVSCYTTIAKMINESESNILFLTASPSEAKASKLAGFCVRNVQREPSVALDTSNGQSRTPEDESQVINDLVSLIFPSGKHNDATLSSGTVSLQ
ncbi:Enolase-phosphatase E1 [Halotydeus destructor]|nr:Enolase-phosphatase E1 [Halotydeus destructor]